jgi:hypothetical protein
VASVGVQALMGRYGYPLTLRERLLLHARLTGGGCWTWLGALDADGYGKYVLPRDGHWKQRRYLRPHRLAYEEFVGPIPEGLTLDHRCRNRACINPSHLEPVPSVENVMRGEGAGAKNARKTHCKSGHPLAGDNLVLTTYRGRAWRACRTCRRRWSREAQARRRAARRAEMARETA